ncbi:MAG: hypothetical protein AB2L26_08535 [Ignavibacteria bacterium]
MRILKLFLICSTALVSLYIFSCDSTVTNIPITEEVNFSIPIWDYSDYHYFFDTLYKRSYRETIGDSINGGFIYTQYVEEHRINTLPGSLEVWIQCDNTEPTKRLCVGKVMLGPRPEGGYDSSVINPHIVPGLKYVGYFRKLMDNEYYYDGYAGFIGLRISAQNLHVGVVYKIYNDGTKYGRGSNESFPTDTLVLKLIKTDLEYPEIAPLAWELKMKNVYRLPVENLSSGTKIYLQHLISNTPSRYIDSIPGYSRPLVTMLKLDRYQTGTYNSPPDGFFDWRPGITIIPQTGDVLFPSLNPFSEGLGQAGIIDSAYLFNELYIQTKTYAQQSPKASLYYLRGKTVQN